MPGITNTYSTKTYVLLHFEHKNYVTVIIKFLYGAMITTVTSFLCSKCNRT